MSNRTTETLKLADVTVSLYRNVKLMGGAREFGVADRMIVQHLMGNEEDVVVFIDESGNLKAKGAMPQIQIQSTSPALDATSRGGYSLADLDAKNEARLLAIYKLFSKSTSNHQ